MTTIREWCGLYVDGEFDVADEDVQARAGWIDWVCKLQQLPSKTKAMAGLLTRLRDGGRVLLDECSVSFKNTQPEGAQAYDLAVISGRGDIRYVCTVDDQRPSDGAKWHVYDYVDGDGSAEPTRGFDTVVQLAKWLNTPKSEPRMTIFEVESGFTSAELFEAAVADAREKFDVEPSFLGIMRKYFRSDEQALVWLRAQLPRVDEHTLLVAFHGKSVTAGYVVAE